MSATFKQNGQDVRDRKKSYYYPEHFSGKAVLDALDIAAKRYPVATRDIFMQGMSGGAQFVHRFAIWAPNRVCAVAVNSCSWFDEPKQSAKLCAWLVTIGESDPTFANSLDFINHLRESGVVPLFRYYTGMGHEGSSRVDSLDCAFFEYYDELTRSKLIRKNSVSIKPVAPNATKDMPFVGDLQEWTFLENTKENRDKIPEDCRVYLPSKEIAIEWQYQTGD